MCASPRAFSKSRLRCKQRWREPWTRSDKRRASLAQASILASGLWYCYAARSSTHFPTFPRTQETQEVSGLVMNHFLNFLLLSIFHFLKKKTKKGNHRKRKKDPFCMNLHKSSSTALLDERTRPEQTMQFCQKATIEPNRYQTFIYIKENIIEDNSKKKP